MKPVIAKLSNMIPHKLVFFKFRQYLKNYVKRQKTSLDIRNHVLSLAKEPISFGFNDFEFSTYSNNLQQIFSSSVSNENPQWKNGKYFFSLGTIYSDQELSDNGATLVFKISSPQTKILFMEQCFLASAGSWAECFQNQNTTYSCLGYFYDDLAHYFMAEYPNRLIEKLNSDEGLNKEQSDIAKTNLVTLVQNRISKYNSQSLTPLKLSTKYNRRVLVCDQTFPDAAVQYGLADETNFQAMLAAAIDENPDAEILLKLHPDTMWDPENKRGYLGKVEESKNIRVIREPMNPFILFDLVDTVYTVTSHLGLEALFAKKKVICFGSPFYAGWGLTDDRQQTPHRVRNRNLEELFYFTYIWYTIYNVPHISGPSSIEAAINYILANRPV